MRKTTLCPISLLFFFTFLSGISCVSGATIESKRSNNGVNIIIITGALENGDEKQFIRTALDFDSATVILESPGGNLRAGLEIGKAIRLKGFSTYVADGEYCASACALAWLGGERRLMSNSARIGFHGAYQERNGEKVTTSAGNALVGAYLSQLGLSERAIIYITQANPTSMMWLSLNDAQRLGISVEPFDIASTQQQKTQPKTPAPPPNISVSRLEDEAVKFFAEIQRVWSLENYNSLSTIESFYSNNVVYYGKTISREQVMREKTDFAYRWSRRQYRPIGGTVKASCTPTGSCSVTGLVSWWAENAQQRTTSTGTAELNLGIQIINAIPKISIEDGRVISRDVQRR
jgi:hypothetical protein